jgi:hypothetical protein
MAANWPRQNGVAGPCVNAPNLGCRDRRGGVIGLLGATEERPSAARVAFVSTFFIAVLGITMAIPMKRQAQPTFIEVWDRRTPRVPFQQTSILAVVHRLARRCGVCLLRCWAPLQTSFAFPSILDFGMPSRRALLPSTASPAIALAVWSRCLPSSAHGQRSHAIDGTRSVLDGIGSGALVGVR